MSYRPKDWNNPYALKKGHLGITDPLEPRVLLKNAYEAGADAMYSALWKMAEESPTKTFTLDTNATNCPGFSTPDEAEEYEQATAVEFTADDII